MRNSERGGSLKVLFDTSVLVAAFLERHEFHDRALAWFQMAERKEIDGVVSAHSLTEMYKVLTGMPSRPRIIAVQLWDFIRDRIAPVFEIVALADIDYLDALERFARLDIRGGTIYDALIAHAAVKANAERIVTFNESDFIRVSAGLPVRITAL